MQARMTNCESSYFRWFMAEKGQGKRWTKMRNDANTCWPMKKIAEEALTCSPNLKTRVMYFGKRGCRVFDSQKKATHGFLTSELFCSTSLALLGSSWVPKEAKNLKEHEFLGLSCCFSVRFEKSSKTSKIGPKRIEKRHFLLVFWSLFKFSRKTATQT